jgi:hypothetical protein
METMHLDTAVTTSNRVYRSSPIPKHRLDVPLRARGEWFLPVAIVGCLLLGILLRPWRTGGTSYLLFHLVLLHGIAWWTLPGEFTSDSTGYVLDARTGLSDFAPTYFPQGMALLLWVLDQFPLELGTKLACVQHLMMVLPALWLHRLLALVTNPFVALAAAIAAGSMATPLLYPKWSGPSA